MAWGGHENCICTRHQADYCIKHNSVKFYCYLPGAAFFFAVEGRISGGVTIKVLLHFKWAASDRSLTHAPGCISTPPRPRAPKLLARPFCSCPPFLSSRRPASMCIECVPPELLKLSPKDHDRYYRLVGGRRCNNLNTSYVMPADEDELRVRSRINDIYLMSTAMMK